MTECKTELVGLVLLSLALLISVCVNVFFCIRLRATLCKDTETCCYRHIYQGERLSQDEGQYFNYINDHEQQENSLNHHEQQENSLNHHEQQENSLNHHEQQENPIYGNIRTERQGSVGGCYEMMTMQHTRDRMKTLEADLNYASLDLKLAKKHKKRHRHKHQGRNSLQDQLTVHPVNAFMVVEADLDAHLPSRDTSTMVSHSSIYLNSQQIVQEAEEMEREWGMNVEREKESWEGIRGEDDHMNKVRKGREESEERMEFSIGNVCALTSKAEESCTNHFIGSFSHDDVQQD
nr:uncharacterized protein LOC109988364 isoform X1 [Labrus bergylta]